MLFIFRRKKTKIVDDDCNDVKDGNEDSVSLDESVSKIPKGSKLKKAISPERSKRNAVKGKTETSDALSGEVSKLKKKQRNKAVKAPVKKKVKAALSTAKNELNESKISTEKTLTHQNQPRLAKLRKNDAKQSGVGDTDKINSEVKEKFVSRAGFEPASPHNTSYRRIEKAIAHSIVLFRLITHVLHLTGLLLVTNKKLRPRTLSSPEAVLLLVGNKNRETLGRSNIGSLRFMDFPLRVKSDNLID